MEEDAVNTHPAYEFWANQMLDHLGYLSTGAGSTLT